MEPQRPQGVEDSMDKMAVLFTAGFGDRRNSGTMIMRVILTTVPGRGACGAASRGVG